MGEAGREKSWHWGLSGVTWPLKGPQCWANDDNLKLLCFWNIISSFVKHNYSVNCAMLKMICESGKWVRCQCPCCRKSQSYKGCKTVHRDTHIHGSWSQRWSWESGTLGNHGNYWKGFELLQRMELDLKQSHIDLKGSTYIGAIHFNLFWSLRWLK